MKRALAFLLIAVVSTMLYADGPRIALVLGGGGARGIAHIAVLEALEAEGIPIDLVVGTSMGSLVGGLYSAGYTPQEIRTLLTTIDLVGLFSSPPLDRHRVDDWPFVYSYEHLFTLGFGKLGIGDVPALISDQRVLELLGFLFAKYPNPIDFDSLPIPFRCVSTDILTAQRIVHQEGSLVSAIRSSISIPIVFTPFPQGDGRLAVDGGVVDNLPIELARSLGYDIVIACDVNEMQIEDPQQLMSLSAVAMQTIILVTQKAASAQHESADLVFLPKLDDVFALDFTKYDVILDRGVAAVEEKRIELQHIAKQVAEQRQLLQRNPRRTGSYALLSDPKILQIEVKDISGHECVRKVSARRFYPFLGRRLDTKTAHELHLKLREIKRELDLASLSYEMSDGGTLTIYARGFGQQDSFVSMGFQADMGISNTLPASLFWSRADAFLDARSDYLFDTDLALEVHATLGQKSGMSLGLFHPLAVFARGALDVGFEMSYSVGSLSVYNAVVNADRTAPLDRSFSTALRLLFSFHQYGRSELKASYSLDSLNDCRYDRQFVAQPQIQLTTIYNSLRGRFARMGSRHEILLSLGYDQELTYAFRAGVRRMFALGPSDSIGYDLQISFMRESKELISSYAEVGSHEGVPGYGALVLRRDLALLGLMYQKRIVEVLGYPSYGKFILRGGFFDSYDPYHDAFYESCRPFSMVDWDVGMAFALGMQAPIGEVIAQIGTSLKGKVSFSVGVY
jgi:NTE family protein